MAGKDQVRSSDQYYLLPYIFYRLDNPPFELLRET